MAATIQLQPSAVRKLLESGANMWHALSGQSDGDQPLTLCMQAMSRRSDDEVFFERGTECARALLEHSGLFSEHEASRSVATDHIAGAIFCCIHQIHQQASGFKLCVLDRMLSLGVPVDAKPRWLSHLTPLGFVMSRPAILASECAFDLCACLLRHGADPCNSGNEGEPPRPQIMTEPHHPWSHTTGCSPSLVHDLLWQVNPSSTAPSARASCRSCSSSARTVVPQQPDSQPCSFAAPLRSPC
jgi:hypothetical protein